MNNIVPTELLETVDVTLNEQSCRRCDRPRDPKSKNGLCHACDASFYRKRKLLKQRNPAEELLTVTKYIEHFPAIERKVVITSQSQPCQRCPYPVDPSSKNKLCRSCDTAYYVRRKQLRDEDLTKPDLTVAEFLRRFPARDIIGRRNAAAEMQHIKRELIPGFMFTSLPMHRMANLIEKVSRRDTAVLIVGETGVGKELVASAVHQLSQRCKNPYVVVDCTTLGHELAESELFGHIKGSFTGATGTKKGLFAEAHTGTIFLDEISALPPNLQPKLLRILEQRQFRPVGSTKYESVDIRLVGATNEPLEEMVKQGRFRADLFHRLNVVQIRIPPLRERREEIPFLVQHFLSTFDEGNPWITDEALKLLQRYDWPGNVRELRNSIERAIVMRDDNEAPITPEEFSSELFG